MSYAHTIGGSTYTFADLKDVLAKASPARSGDYLAGLAARTAVERMAAKMCLAELPLTTFLNESVIPYESDEVTRLIVDRHDAAAFAEIRHMTVGDFRNWLLLDSTDEAALNRVAPGVTPEMAAGVSKLMRNQDLILGGQEVPGHYAFPQHHRSRRTLVGPAATQSSYRRPQGYRRLDTRWLAVRMRGRRRRHQPRDRQRCDA